MIVLMRVTLVCASTCFLLRTQNWGSIPIIVPYHILSFILLCNFLLCFARNGTLK